MKLKILVLAIIGSSFLSGQSQKGSQESFFDQLRSDAIILSEGGLIRGEEEIEEFVSDLAGSPLQTYSYEKNFHVEVSASLIYEIGLLSSDSKSFAVMFITRNDAASGPGIEFLVIYEQKDVPDQPSELNASRTEWMRLCNAHQVDQLVTRLYASNAYYYNRGRLLAGTKALAEEYSYMSDPNYSLKLTPKHIAFVTSVIAYEIGQCSGSYPNPYMLLWEKGADGRWVILMDSND